MKVMIAYGTRYGSTSGVADRIATILSDNGHECTVQDLRKKNGGDLDQYDAFVLGSAIFVGSWTKEAKTFISENLDVINGRPLAVFICCGDYVFGGNDIDACRRIYIDGFVEEIGLNEPLSKEVLGGCMDFNRYGMLVKTVLYAKGVQKDLRSKGMVKAEPYDFRDWEHIESWASDLAESLHRL